VAPFYYRMPGPAQQGPEDRYVKKFALGCEQHRSRQGRQVEERVQVPGVVGHNQYRACGQVLGAFHHRHQASES
jgi:hypothetical protein